MLFFIAYYDSSCIKEGLVYFTQCLKYEPFRSYSELKICFYAKLIIYDLAQSKNYYWKSDPDLAGYL